MTLLRYALPGLCAVLLAVPAWAQTGRPATHRLDARPLAEVARYDLPPMDNAALVARDAARLDGTPRPFRFAEPVDLALAAERSGTWETLGDGTRAWRLRVASPGAYSLNVGFSRFRLPEGAALWVYPAGGAPTFRPFTAADNEEHGQLWTPIVPGDELVIELDLPESKPGDEPAFELEVGRVSHAYRPFGLPGEAVADKASGSCNVDVVCPEGNGYRDVIRSVGAYTRSGIDICSGAAVNNASGTTTPYFLTANHCGNSAGNAASVVIYWNYENTTCRVPGSPQSGGPGDGPLTQFSTGTLFRGSSSASDWALLETDDPIPAEYSVYLAGWDRRDQATASAIAIHHPQVEEKRISFEDQATSITTYLSNTPTPTGTHIRVADWDLGTTEPGSSGSPLFSPEKRIIGQLHGGYAACSNDDPDWYGRVYHSMNTGLAQWLDPGNTGVAFIDGQEAGNPPGPIQLLATMEADPVSVSPGDTTTFTITVFNNGTETAEGVEVENELPALLNVVAGSLSASAGEAAYAGGAVTWEVDVEDDGSATLSYAAVVDEAAPGLPLTNAAIVRHDSLAVPLQPSAVLDIFVAPDYLYTSVGNVAIPDNACPSYTTSTIEVADAFEPINLKVGVNLDHTWRGDLRIRLTSPEGTTVGLLGRVGGSADNLDALFSDSGPAGAFGSGDHVTAAPFYDVEGQPEGEATGPLAPFLGEDPRGTWTLGICDAAGQDLGTLRRWALFFYTENTTGTGEEAALTEAYRLEPAFPNPFAQETLVRFAVREAQAVRAEVYDALGRRVRVLHDGPVAAEATQVLRLDAEGLTSGVYVVRVTGEAFSATQKVMVLR